MHTLRNILDSSDTDFSFSPKSLMLIGMIRYLHKSIKAKTLTESQRYKAGSWIYAEAPTEEEIQSLVKRFKLEPGHLEDSQDDDEMPRMEKEGSSTYFFTRFPYTDNELHIRTTPLLLIVNKDNLITISKRPIPRLERFMSGRIEFNTTQRTKLLLQIMDQVVDQYDTYLNSISRQIKAIRSRLRVEAIRNKDFIDFVVIEDELNEFMSAITPTNAILKRMLIGKHIKLFDSDEDIVEDLMLNNEQTIESCRLNIKSVVSIREAYSTIMSNNLNRVIRMLTVLTVLISVPTLITSIYGMNVQLPFQDSQYTFIGIFFFSVGICLVLLKLFDGKRWL